MGSWVERGEGGNWLSLPPEGDDSLAGFIYHSGSGYSTADRYHLARLRERGIEPRVCENCVIDALGRNRERGVYM